MINVDAHEVTYQDLVELKKRGIRISNPNTEDKICVSCLARGISSWYDDDHEDSDYGVRSLSSFGSLFGGFGGFGGGRSFGGGASGSW